MYLLKERVEKYEILNPLIVRPVPDGVYEIISVHRRKYAAELLGYIEPDDIGTTLVTIMINIINDEEIREEKGILHHEEQVDLLPANSRCTR